MEAEAAKAIGAGIACIGMGGAGIGLGHIFGNFLAGAIRNPAAADGPVRPPDLRLRRDRGARHLLAADRAHPAVRLSREPVIKRSGIGNGRQPAADDAGAGNAAGAGSDAYRHRSAAAGRAEGVPAVRLLDLSLAAPVARDHLRPALLPDGEGGAAAPRRHPRGPPRPHRRRSRHRRAAEGGVGRGGRRPTRRRWPTPAPMPPPSPRPPARKPRSPPTPSGQRPRPPSTGSSPPPRRASARSRRRPCRTSAPLPATRPRRSSPR